MTDKKLKLDKKIDLLNKFFQKKITIDEDLFKSGYLDSLKVIDLIFFIEQKTKKKIPTKKINQKSFNTLNNILKIF
jgi:acyl carrier protein|tara:strand:+ start:1234 stop:1461 length:228 start_codon:yes stop_codon:yes gene_type:complete